MPRDKRIFTPLVIDVSGVLKDEQEVLQSLDSAYVEYAMVQEQFVLDARDAEIGGIDAQITGLRARQQMVRLHKELSKHIPEVAQNPMVLVYKKNGKLTVEIPYTERTMRNMMRAQAANAERQISEADSSNLDMFEDGGENPDEEQQ